MNNSASAYCMIHFAVTRENLATKMEPHIQVHDHARGSMLGISDPYDSNIPTPRPPPNFTTQLFGLHNKGGPSLTLRHPSLEPHPNGPGKQCSERKGQQKTTSKGFWTPEVFERNGTQYSERSRIYHVTLREKSVMTLPVSFSKPLSVPNLCATQWQMPIVCTKSIEKK
ncbi:MAG: hypothetical protein Q9215_003505 [Flavoplaca cf. flavocitrina]